MAMKVKVGCSRRGDQGMGYRGAQRGTARTGYHALRTALEVGGGREQGDHCRHAEKAALFF